MPRSKKKTYKDIQREFAQMAQPRVIPWPELLELSEDPDNPKRYNPPIYQWTRKQIRNIRFKTHDRRFTRPQGEKFDHVVMDHNFEREKLDPRLSNHERHTMNQAQRRAHRAFQKAAEVQNA